MTKQQSTLFTRIENEIQNYTTSKVEISPGVFFSQYDLINRIYSFRNRNLTGEKINPDLSYNYYFDIISPRTDNEIKNLRFDTKNIMVFSHAPIKDFAAVFLSNASLKSWMAKKGEDIKLKTAVEEFSAMGNVGFKKVPGGYDIIDPRNTFITNIKAKDIEETDIIERHELSASQIRAMTDWDETSVNHTIKKLGNKTFSATSETTPTDSTSKKYEVYEFTGEVNEKEFNEAQRKQGGDENKYFLAKVIVSGLKASGTGEKFTLFAEKLTGTMRDWYEYAHKGKYEGRFWRVGMYETLFDHQIRANEIGNQLARALEWASKAIFRSKDRNILQNIRADLDNGDIIITEDLTRVDVRIQGADQLINDWNRLMSDADKLSNSYEIVRGEALPSGTPFRMGLLMDQNAGKLFILLRQKLTLPFKRVFREWVLPELIKDLKGKDVFRFVGDNEILDQLREILVESWYSENLVAIGPHSKETAQALKDEKLEEVRKADPAIKNTKEIWEAVMPRLFITITGENYDLSEQLQDLTTLIGYEQDPERINWILDQIYRSRNIPVPPRTKPPEQLQVQPQAQEVQKTTEPALPVS